MFHVMFMLFLAPMKQHSKMRTATRFHYIITIIIALYLEWTRALLLQTTARIFRAIAKFQRSEKY